MRTRKGRKVRINNSFTRILGRYSLFNELGYSSSVLFIIIREKKKKMGQEGEQSERNNENMVLTSLLVHSALRTSFWSSFSSTTPTQGQRKKRMPPKKAAAAEKKTLLGRPSNNLKIGIVGLFCFQSSKWSDLTFPSCLTFRIAQCWQVVLLQCLVQDRYEKKLFSRQK